MSVGSLGARKIGKFPMSGMLSYDFVSKLREQFRELSSTINLYAFVF